MHPRMKVQSTIMLAQSVGRHRLEFVLLGACQEQQRFRERRARIEPQLVVEHDLLGLRSRDDETFAMRNPTDQRRQIDLVANHAADNA